MSRERLNNLPPEKLEKLFESAALEFATHGYERASLNRIIADAGMGKSSLYYYFNDKADLFSTLVERALAHFIRDIGGFDYTVLTAETYWPALGAIMHKSVTFMEKNTWYVRLGRLFYNLRPHDKGARATGGLYKAAHGWLEQLLRHGQGLGVVRTDLPDALLVQAAFALAEVCDRYFMETFETRDAEGRHALVGQQIDMFRRLLG